MIIDELKGRYLQSGLIQNHLAKNDISVLIEFLENWETMKKFYDEFYSDKAPKVVLCGINPGRLGAGLTGIPFIDFKSLAKIMHGITRNESERSAQFFYEIIGTIGVKKFYSSFYVTNISWLGYIQNNKNLNYYNLPLPAQNLIFDIFKYEMSLIRPSTIISLSKDVKKTVDQLFGDTAVDTQYILPHPYYSSISSNREKCKAQYLDLLSIFVENRNL